MASKSVLKRDRPPRRGDLVLFSLSQATPASPRADRVLAGVVESSSKGRITFIAPVGGTVTRGTATVSAGGRKGTDTALMTCAAPKTTKIAKADKAGKPGKKTARNKADKRPPALPCRAGELLIGTVDIETAARALGR